MNEIYIWISFGLFLIAIELILPYFASLIFGLGAIIVGLVLLIIPTTHIYIQVLIWLLFSIVICILWFKKLKYIFANKNNIDDLINATGYLLKYDEKTFTGIVRFSIPINGKEEWSCISLNNSHLEVNQRVRVVEYNKLDNTLIVIQEKTW